MAARPKPVQKPHPPILVGGAFPYSARRAIRYGDGWLPQVTASSPEPLTTVIPRFRQMAAEAGRDPATLTIAAGSQPLDAALIEQYAKLDVDIVYPSLPSEPEDVILRHLDQWAEMIRRFGG